MKISLDMPDSAYFVRSYIPGSITLNQTAYDHTVIVHGEMLLNHPEIKDIRDLSDTLILSLIDKKPEVVILGTGESQNFPQRSTLKHFINAQIGVEIMNTHAAARTYNILAQDGRNVMGVFLV